MSGTQTHSLADLNGLANTPSQGWIAADKNAVGEVISIPPNQRLFERPNAVWDMKHRHTRGKGIRWKRRVGSHGMSHSKV